MKTDYEMYTDWRTTKVVMEFENDLGGSSVVYIDDDGYKVVAVFDTNDKLIEEYSYE